MTNEAIRKTAEAVLAIPDADKYGDTTILITFGVMQGKEYTEEYQIADLKALARAYLDIKECPVCMSLMTGNGHCPRGHVEMQTFSRPQETD